MTLSSSFLKKTVLNDPTIKVFKRLFDVVFSTIVIIGLCPGWCHFGDFNKTGIKRAGVFLDKEGRDRWKWILLLQV
jgi:lipopolysaccharide/colanic/teichoic acid biosynthesis glycosyltransferase